MKTHCLLVQIIHQWVSEDLAKGRNTSIAK